MNKKIPFLLSLFLTAVFSSLLTIIAFQQLTMPTFQAALEERLESIERPRQAVRVGNFFEDGKTDFVDVSSAITESVVNIRTIGSGFALSGGSGVVLSEDGYIMTNYHVIEGANRIEVTFNNKREMEARIVGVDPTTDLALIKVRAKNLIPVTFGDSDAVDVGQWVLAIGNPFNLTSTVTAGIVSAKARNINILGGGYAIESFIQTDAAVNPGNSGGALVNERGELVGINTAIMTEDGNFDGYSFAVPSNLVYKVMRDLKDFGKVKRALLGVNILDVDDDRARELGLTSVAGVFIQQVNPGSSAETAGLQPGDVIIRVNGIETTSVPELQEQVARFRPGDIITVDYIRNGKQFSVNQVELQGLADNSN